MTDDSFAIIVDLHAAPGKGPELQQALTAIVAPTLAEPGCLRYDLHQDLADPESFTFYEVWESPGHLSSHDASDHIKAIARLLPSLLRMPSTARRLRRLPAAE